MVSLLDGAIHSFLRLLIGILLLGALSGCGGIALAAALRARNLRWTWSVWVLGPALLSSYLSLWISLLGVGVCVVGCTVGLVWHSHDLMAGADRAATARKRLGMLAAATRAAGRWQAARRSDGWVANGRLEVGWDEHGCGVSMPVGGLSGSHALILGATGSGKTCGQAWIACRLIEHGHGAVAIDPKGDEMLRKELERAAVGARRPFLPWSPQGPLAYNPYAHGTDSEIADKALAGESFTEPHYLRQAQRYVGHVVRLLRTAQLPVTAASLMAHMDPDRLEQTANGLDGESKRVAYEYLDSLTSRQRHDLSGVRDRLSILAESEIAPWLDPGAPGGVIDLAHALRERAVVCFSVEADRRPLLARMLAAAIVGDLITLAADLQDRPVPTAVLIDEFSAVAPEQVSRLFARGRSAGMSLLLATQELADLKAAGLQALRDQALGNVETVLAYRQNVPESAELIAAVAGTRPAWVTTQRTAGALLGGVPMGGALRRREHEHAVHPSCIKGLRTGEAVVLAPGSGQEPVVAHIHHPSTAHANLAGSRL